MAVEAGRICPQAIAGRNFCNFVRNVTIVERG
jgi:hypothetical protein